MDVKKSHIGFPRFKEGKCGNGFYCRFALTQLSLSLSLSLYIYIYIYEHELQYDEHQMYV